MTPIFAPIFVSFTATLMVPSFFGEIFPIGAWRVSEKHYFGWNGLSRLGGLKPVPTGSKIGSKPQLEPVPSHQADSIRSNRNRVFPTRQRQKKMRLAEESRQEVYEWSRGSEKEYNADGSGKCRAEEDGDFGDDPKEISHKRFPLPIFWGGRKCGKKDVFTNASDGHVVSNSNPAFKSPRKQPRHRTRPRPSFHSSRMANPY
ncbi:hypothetical protein B0H11DRAFT_1924964 [Mycena galericulata]|nr:hypothetical protein B0H11DRAFT_1924964 [Mycena galericulata]